MAPKVMRRRGFTIVELLIVIVVIAILAAIVTIAYNGITKRARDTAIDTNLTEAAKKLEAYKVLNNDQYPSDLASADLGNAYNGYTYKATANGGYCLSGVNDNGAFRIKNGGAVEAGKCDLDGVVTTLAVGGTGIDMLRALAFDSTGNIYGTNRYASSDTDSKVMKIDTNGVASQFAGSGTPGFADGTGTAAQFDGPSDLEVDKQNNIYVADTGNSRIRKITPGGVVSTLVGSAGIGVSDGSCATAQIAVPTGLAFDNNGDLYFTDAYSRVRKIAMSTCTVSTVAGPAYGTLADAPVYGEADGNGTAARFNQPTDIEYGPDGNFYISEPNEIRKMTPSGQVTTVVATDGTVLNGTNTTIAIDTDGTIYRANEGNENILKITPAGAVTIFAGSTRGYQDGTGTQAQFYRPQGITFAPDGSLYVADTYGRYVRIIR